MKEKMSKLGFRKSLAAILLSLCLAAGLLTAAPKFQARAETDPIDAQAPVGTINIAQGMASDARCVHISKENNVENTLELWGWNKYKLTDGAISPKEQFSTTNQDTACLAATSVDIEFDFKSVRSIKQITLFRVSDDGMANFPAQYTIELSSDGVSYTTEANVTALPGEGVMHVNHTFAEFKQSRYVKIAIQKAAGALIQLAEIAIYGTGEPFSSINVEAPEGTFNLADGLATDDNKVIIGKLPEGSPGIANNSCNAAHENTYQMDGWLKENLTDGSLTTKGYSSNPFDLSPQSVEIAFDLGGIRNVAAVSVFRASGDAAGTHFPRTYTVSVSENGTDYTNVVEVTDAALPEMVATHLLQTAQKARYVKVLFIRPNAAAHIQLGEIAIFGNFEGIPLTMEINKPALNLPVGESEQLSAFLAENGVAMNFPMMSAVTFESDNEQVATVDGNGNVLAIAKGTANISVASGEYSATVKVDVVERKEAFDDNILVTIFFPPTKRYLGDDDAKWTEQYDLLANAGIDYVNNVNGGAWDLVSKEDNLRMAAECYSRGMRVSVADSRMGPNFRNLTKEQIAELIGEYRNVSGVAGYYIQDEPYNPNIYTDTYRYMKDVDPNGYMHLNFLPYSAYPSVQEYEAQMNDWLSVNAAAGYPQEYLMYDLYPYPDNNNKTMNRVGFFTNMEAVRKVGLANNIKTGNYLQTMRIEGSYRMPTASEVRYEAMCGMAYGFKQFSYFTWMQPDERHGEAFRDAIIGIDGKITNQALYNSIAALNDEIHNLGATLIKLDAHEVYLNGQLWGQKAISSEFFAQATDNKDFTISYLRHKVTGRNYMMLVNNNFSDKQTIKVKLSDKITGVERVSAADGTLSAVTLGKGNTLSVELAAGDGALYALPESYDYEKEKTTVPQPDNLAANAKIIADSSVGENYLYLCNLNDGIRFSDASRQSNGWASTAAQTNITLDFGESKEFNRIDLYPHGSHVLTYGYGLPKAFKLQTSADGKEWTDVKSYDNFKVEGVTPPGLTLDDVVSARYLRIAVTESHNGYVAFAEIEVYNDDGNIPAPEYSLTDKNNVVVWQEGKNIAKNKTVVASSAQGGAQYREWGWAIDFINDGKTDNGWTSEVGANRSPTANEWIAIDFCDLFALSQVKLYNEKGMKFPLEWKVQYSADGYNWTDTQTVTETGDEIDRVGWREVNFDAPVTARYIRVFGVKLRNAGADGYMMQIAEIEAYGTPVVNKTEAQTFWTDKVAALGDLTDEKAPALKQLESALKDGSFVTQSLLNKILGESKIEYEKLTTVDSASANALISRVEGLTDEDLHGKDASVLADDLAALKNAVAAIGEKACTQRRLDALAQTLQDKLDALLLFPVSELSVNIDKLTIANGQTGKIEVNCLPVYTTDAVKFESLDTDIATVDGNGNVMAVSNGNTVIRVKCGDKTLEVRVHVNAPQKPVEQPKEKGCGGSMQPAASAGVAAVLLLCGFAVNLLRRRNRNER